MIVVVIRSSVWPGVCCGKIACCKPRSVLRSSDSLIFSANCTQLLIASWEKRELAWKHCTDSLQNVVYDRDISRHRLHCTSLDIVCFNFKQSIHETWRRAALVRLGNLHSFKQHGRTARLRAQGVSSRLHLARSAKPNSLSDVTPTKIQCCQVVRHVQRLRVGSRASVQPRAAHGTCYVILFCCERFC